MTHSPARAVATDPLQTQNKFWGKVPLWKNTKNLVGNTQQLFRFLQAVLLEEVPLDKPRVEMQTRDNFIQDVMEGINQGCHHVRPYDNDPIARQFIPLKPCMIPDHPKLTLNPLHEEADSLVKGLIHRHLDKVMF
ncbi:hypothetical protein N0V88_006590 [Collariella sp. IMI 366227]|nr:hypothetical protein N0V88_006590 [Collariella sp. IMI 366227]